MLIPIVQKGKKFVTFALVSIYMELLWTYVKKVSTGMVDEKVTVISSVLHTYIVHTKAELEVGNGISANFLVTEAGNALAALGNIHEGDSHILK
jgi:hypothetical protein